MEVSHCCTFGSRCFTTYASPIGTTKITHTFHIIIRKAAPKLISTRWSTRGKNSGIMMAVSTFDTKV